MHKGEVKFMMAGTNGRISDVIDGCCVNPHKHYNQHIDIEDTVYDTVFKGRKDKARERRARKGFKND